MESKPVNELGSTIAWNDIVKPDDVSIHLFWELFASLTLSEIDKDSVQYKEIRKAFMCGFIECFKFMTDFASNLPEDQVCELFSSIAKENNKIVSEFIK